MHDGKLVRYNAVLWKGYKGTPVMFFVVPGGTKNKVPKKICDNAETFLIQAAYHENRELCNRHKTSLPQWGIKGIIRGGKGKRAPIELFFGRMMGL